jgi:hypothetical protein
VCNSKQIANPRLDENKEKNTIPLYGGMKKMAKGLTVPTYIQFYGLDY